MNHVIPISGKDSLSTYILQSEFKPDIDYKIIYNDTGLELPETYKWLSDIETKLNIKIERIGKNLLEIIYEQGILPSPRTRYCTRLSKIYPMEDFFGKDETVVYFGIRADEKRMGYKPSSRAKITPKYPLVDFGITINDVYKILSERDLLPPTFFWDDIYHRVITRLGDLSHLVDELQKWEFDRLFAWRSRPNCYNCFFQRQYEFIGLHDNHIELFNDAVSMESEVGATGFNLKQSGSLSDLLKKREQIIDKRVSEITKYIIQKSQASFFINNDSLTSVSCGLFCGK